MARLFYTAPGGVVAAVATDPSDVGPSYVPDAAVFDVFDAREGGSAVTDLLDVDGSTPITAVSPPDGTAPACFGPDDYRGGLWLQDQANPTAPRYPMFPEDMPDRTNTAGAVAAGDLTDSGTAGIASVQAETPDDARAVIGLSDIGEALATAADEDDVQTAMGATPKGKSLVTAADDAAVRAAAGAGAVGDDLFTSTTQADALADLGAGALGVTIFNSTAGSTVRGAISAPSQAETDLKIKAIVGGTAFQFGKGPIANRPAPGTPGLEDGALWLETA